jgi:hypothetical protein
MTREAGILFALSSVIWGIPYLFIKIAVDGGVPPGFVAWSWIAIAAMLLVPIALRRGAMTGLRARAGAIVAYAACEVMIVIPVDDNLAIKPRRTTEFQGDSRHRCGLGEVDQPSFASSLDTTSS